MIVEAYLDGQFRSLLKGREWTDLQPYRLNEPLCRWFEDISLVQEAVSTAHDEFASFSSLARSQRVELLKKLKLSFEKHETEFENLIVLESGKARWESRQEAKALSNKIQITLDTLLPLVEQIEATGRTGKQEMKLLARGVCAVIGPFNFPLHLANGHIIPALLAGNTVIFKTSEHSPLCAGLYARCFQEAGFPVGAFQMLPGGAESGQCLVENTLVKGVFFTGSYQNGRRITERLLKTRSDLATLAALELGGKNACIIFEDADFDRAIGESVLSAFATAGQRCSCASRLFIQESLLDKFRDAFLMATNKIRIGDPSDDKTFMGCMISPEAADHFISKCQTATSQGFVVHQMSQRLDKNNCLVLPSVFESSKPDDDVQKPLLQEELFGPNTILIPFEDQEHLVELHEASPYGLASAVFSRDENKFNFLDQHLSVGLLNWNRTTVGASSALPFGGTKKSGNNWPAGLFSYFYCSYPRSYLKESEAFSTADLPSPLQNIFGAVQ
ncbi:MAG: hypothetical protein COV44_08215 [Deltaproteobacteria bacterium CG11_big_fil_rev_8_21_14_0_20_45_16]|nr:MAG: hypothetical protein COV44_08215 [Deltaproteobacteria bacterium CG11_big_fil_rev_8_21_14_0_20_45_16]